MSKLNNEQVKAESRGLRGPLSEDLASSDAFLSEAGKLLIKFHGSYEQTNRDKRGRGRQGVHLHGAQQAARRAADARRSTWRTTTSRRSTATARCASRRGRASSSTASSRDTCATRFVSSITPS